ncbi:17119_t:CDS:2, partial [Racocetra persica]
SSVYYKKLLEKKLLENVDNKEEEMLLSKEMAKKFYNNITIIDDIKDIKDSPQEISRKIANLIENKEIFVDMTYKTNALGYELYSVIGQYDGLGLVLAYLFVKGYKQDK